MFYYLWTHCVYHLIRWLHRNNRLKLQIVIYILSAALLAPQFYVLSTPQSTRYCDQPLLGMLVVSIIFTITMLGFIVLFTIMDPVPSQVKVAFHAFGFICFIEGIVHSAMVWSSSDCFTYVEILYGWSLAWVVIKVVSTGVCACLVPFWIMDRFCNKCVLDHEEKAGVCYEPVRCCSCVWHV